MKASVFIAATLDGYIATPDGDIDFLNQHPSTNPDEDFGYHAFIDTVDAIVMGRKSFEKVLSFDCDWPYANIPVFVLSRSGVTVPSALSEHVQVLNGDAASISEQLKNRGFKHLYIDGGQTIKAFSGGANSGAHAHSHPHFTGQRHSPLWRLSSSASINANPHAAI